MEINVELQNQIIEADIVNDDVEVSISEDVIEVEIAGAVVTAIGGSGEALEDSIETGEAISSLKVLRNDVSDTAFIADSSDVSDFNRVLGISKEAKGSGEDIAYTISGKLEEALWSWDVTKPIFFDSNGDLTQTPPSSGFSMIVAIPITSKIINVTLKQGIKLT